MSDKLPPWRANVPPQNIDGISINQETAAIRAARNAYCPYSKFQVGAAVRTKAGEVYGGCNFENAAYGSTICAERNAIGAMIADGDREIVSILIYTPTQKPTAPCGACRQVINEFAAPGAKVVSICDSDEVLETTIEELLPSAFGPKNLA